MALKISGTASFQGAVLDALRLICTCRPIKTFFGTVMLGSPVDPCCCDTPLGCSLLVNLIEDCDKDVTIVAHCKSTYDPNDREVNFCTCKSKTALDCDGKQSPVAASLVHELIHAWLHCVDDPNKPYWDETLVICAENQIRREMGETPRCSLSVTPSCGWLPNEWETPDRCRPSFLFWFCKFKAVFKIVFYKVMIRVRWPRLVPIFLRGRMSDTPATPDLWDWTDPPTLAKRIAQAEWVRDHEPLAKRIDELLAEAEATNGRSRPILLLEGITIDHPYEVTLIHEIDGAIEIVSNRAARSRLTRYLFEPQTVVPRARIGDLWSRVIFPSGPPSAFGDPGITDGTVQFLELRMNGLVDRRTAMYGYYFPEENPGVAPPTDPAARERWEAISACHELRDVIMSLGPDVMEWVDE